MTPHDLRAAQFRVKNIDGFACHHVKIDVVRTPKGYAAKRETTRYCGGVMRLNWIRQALIVHGGRFQPPVKGWVIVAEWWQIQTRCDVCKKEGSRFEFKPDDYKALWAKYRWAYAIDKDDYPHWQSGIDDVQEIPF